MKIRVLFFGATAEIVGKRDLEVSINGQVEARAALETIFADFPRLNDHRLFFSINQEYCDADSLVGDGDELAIFTPVSGG